MKPLPLPVFLLATVLALGRPALAAPDLYAPLRHDTRLAKPITVYRERILLGDLLKLIAAETQTELRTSIVDPAMGSIDLTVGASAIPAWKLLGGIVSLHQGPEATWQWTGEGSRAKPYTLTCNERMARLAEVGREGPNRRFQAHVDLLIQGAVLPPDERAAFIARHPEAASRLQSERGRLGIQLFAALPRETQQGVLSGRPLRLRLSTLPPQGQELIQRVWRDAAALNPNNPDFQGDPPQEILIDAYRVPGYFAPMIFISAPRLGGQNYFGGPGLETRLRTEDEVLWRVDAEDHTLPDLPRKPEAPPRKPGEDTQREGDAEQSVGMTATRYVKWLAQAYGVPILSDAAGRFGAMLGVPTYTGIPLKRHWEMLAEAWPLMVKQQEGLVLVRDRRWFDNKAYGVLPYSLFAEVGTLLRKPNPGAEDVFAAFALLADYNHEALHPIVWRYPVTQLAPRIRPALIAYATESRKNQRRLLSPEGRRLADLSIKTKDRLGRLKHDAAIAALLDPDPIRRIRLEYFADTDKVRIGYTLTGGTADVVNTPTLISKSLGFPLFVNTATEE